MAIFWLGRADGQSLDRCLYTTCLKSELNMRRFEAYRSQASLLMNNFETIDSSRQGIVFEDDLEVFENVV